MADSTGGHEYTTTSWWKRLVSEYTGLNFLQVGELDYLQFLTWRRDAFIDRLNQTEAGREYLNNAWRLEQTEPDRAKLRRKLSSEGGAGNGR